QTGDRWPVSNPGLVFQIADPQAAHRLDDEIVEFVGVGAATRERESFAAIDGPAARVLFDERRVARLLDPAADFVDRLIPSDVFPAIGCRTPDLRLQEATLVQNVLLQRRAFRAERPTVDWMIGVPLDVNDLRNRVLRFVAERMNDDAATDRT